MPNSRTLAAVALLAAALTPASPLGAQQPSGAHVILLGTDTLAVERFSRAGDRLEGEVITRAPRTARVTYTAALARNGRISALDMTRYAAPESDSVAQRITMRFDGDSVVTETRSAEGTQRRTTPAATGALPWISNSYAMHALALERLGSGPRDSVAIPFVSPGAAQPSTLVLRRQGRDSITSTIVLDGGEIEHRGSVAQGGRQLLGLEGIGGTYGSHVRRVARLDIAELRRNFAARDREGRGLGVLSPRDTARAQVAGATIEVDYSRPAARGRTIVGGVVPEGDVWRLGANQATHLRTDRDLIFGDATVPAGTYTLFAVAGQDEWMLVVNRQTGQWGTSYDESQDLVRIPMRVTRSAQRVERLTIEPAPAAGGGELRISWGNVIATAPFTTR